MQSSSSIHALRGSARSFSFAVNQARKEISTRFDFKNVVAEIDYEHNATKIGLHAADEYKLDAMWQVLEGRMIARNVPVKNLVRGTAQKASQGTIRQEVSLVQGIEQDIAKKIVKHVKDQKLEGTGTGAGRCRAHQQPELAMSWYLPTIC
jgi:hypothetical protein